MPTSLPVRAARCRPSLGLVDFVATMTSFYAATAIYVALVVALEYRFGMFTSLTLVESIARAASTGLPFSDPQLIGLF
jgi:hypothetical protein